MTMKYDKLWNPLIDKKEQNKTSQTGIYFDKCDSTYEEK